MKLTVSISNIECLSKTGSLYYESYYRGRRQSIYLPPQYGPQPQYPSTRPAPQVKRLPVTGVFKVAVASQSQGGLDDTVSPMFGRCPTFTIVKIENGKIKGVNVVPNQAAYAMHGAGIAAVQALASMGVRAILAGRFGPKAFTVCSQAGIQMIQVQPGTRIEDAVQSFIAGKLRPISAPTAPMHSGIGFTPGPPGMGPSAGVGPRMGTGRGRGRMGGFGAGPGGFCVCPSCGYRSPHIPGTPCFQQVCSQCGCKMIRER